jgi:hypothetical protein
MTTKGHPEEAAAKAESLEPRNGGVAALAGVPRALIGALDDINKIADGMRFLPQLSAHLAAIEGRTNSLDAEVIRMRQAVESLRDQVDGMQKSIDGLEPHLLDVGGAVHPLRRTAARVRRLTRRSDEGDTPTS